MRRANALLPIALSSVALLAGCAGRPLQQGPNDALRAYARALDDGRADDAWKLLSDGARRDVPLEAFRRMVKESPDEVREIARALARPAADPVVTATLTSPKGETLTLVWEKDRWTVDGSAIDLYAQTTPHRALESFLRAFERKRWDVLVRFVPDAHRAGLDEAKLKAAWESADQGEEMRRVADAIRAALPTATIEETGDRATMAYGNGGTVLLLREHGAWRIEDFD